MKNKSLQIYYYKYSIVFVYCMFVSLKEILTKIEEYCIRADLLLEKTADIQLGPKNQTFLLKQARSTKEAVTQLQDQLSKK